MTIQARVLHAGNGLDSLAVSLTTTCLQVTGMHGLASGDHSLSGGVQSADAAACVY